AIEVVTTVRWGPPAPRPADVAGWVARRRIGRGQPLREPAVGPPLAVEAGEPVQVVWRRTGLAVTLPGRALGSAAAGQSVAVRTETGKRMHGTAVGNGVVQVDALSGRVPSGRDEGPAGSAWGRRSSPSRSGPGSAPPRRRGRRRRAPRPPRARRATTGSPADDASWH